MYLGYTLCNGFCNSVCPVEKDGTAAFPSEREKFNRWQRIPAPVPQKRWNGE